MVCLFTSLFAKLTNTNSSSLNPKIRFVKHPLFQNGSAPRFSGWHPYFCYWNQHLWWFFPSIFWSRKPGRPSSGWPGVLQVKQRRSRNDGIQWSHQTKIGFRGRWIPQVFVNPYGLLVFSFSFFLAIPYLMHYPINTVFHHFSIWQILFWDQADKTISGKFTSILFSKNTDSQDLKLFCVWSYLNMFEGLRVLGHVRTLA